MLSLIAAAFKMSTNTKLLFILGVFVCGLSSLTNGALLPVKSATATSTGKLQDAANGRLPGGFTPSHYDIEIAPDIYDEPDKPPSSFNFTGSVAIIVRCDVESTEITMNSKYLTITEYSVEVDPANSVASVQPPPPPTIQLDPAAEFLTLNFTEPLVTNALYIIRMNYSGPVLSPDLPGIYYDYYKDSNGKTRYMVATLFASIFARQMFPCFDEPDLKATFNVTVLRKAPMISLSNMNLVRNETRENGWIADYYAESPVMSTYLLCVCIGHFDYVETEWQNYTNHKIRIYSRPEVIENLEFARQLAPVIHQWHEHETGVAYTLPKMDHIALPTKGGAMENWGLITYGESSFCINEKTSSALSKLSVASIISHELAHQWYGNLVTTKWWNDIWLNEGFATHYNYYPLAAIGWPDSENQQADPRRGTQPFLDIDQRNDSDPVIKEISTSAQAQSAFTGSTYPKGGAMIRMLKGLVTKATMNRAFTAYLKKFDSKSAVTDDLWEVLNEQVITDNITDTNGKPIDVRDIMDPWLKQMGYPLVTVTSIGKGRANVTATRYFNPRGQNANTPSAFNYKWTVPISIATLETQDWEDIRPRLFLKTDEEPIEVKYDKWIVINANQMFFYRVNYHKDIRTALVNQLLSNHSKISCESRGQLIDDSFSMARSLVIDEVDALETTSYLGSELEFNAWSVALKHLLYADKIFQSYKWYPNFKAYVTSLLYPVYLIKGWDYKDKEPPLSQTLRKDVSTTLCYYENKDCVAQALAIFNDYIQKPAVDSVDPNNLPNVLCVGIKNNKSDAAWDAVFDEYQRRRPSPINDERYAYLYGMSCSTEQERLNSFFERIVGGVWVDARDQSTALNYLVQNSKLGRDIVWSYLEDNWPRVPPSVGKFTILRSIASAWHTQESLNSFNQFVSKVGESNSNVIVQIQLLVEQNIDWFNANADAVEKWLTPDVETTTPSSSCRCQVQPVAALLSVLSFIYIYLNYS